MGFNTGSASQYVFDNFDYFRAAVYRAHDGYCCYKYIEEPSNWYVYSYVDPELLVTYRILKSSDEEALFLSEKSLVDAHKYVKPAQITDDNKNIVNVLLSDDGSIAPDANRLTVNVGSPHVTVKPLSSGDPIGISVDFVRYNGSADLIVDGETVPKIFSFNADTYQDITIHEIRVAITTQDFVFDGKHFGLASPLDNGVLIETVLGGQAYEITNVRINEDWLFYSNMAPGVGAMLNNTGPKDVLATGFFCESIVLEAGSNDQVRVTIRDDLCVSGAIGLNYFQIKVFGSFEV